MRSFVCFAFPLLFAATVAVVAASAAFASGPVRQTLNGPVVGTAHPALDGGVPYESYMGIPYAEDTSGKNRWAPPVPKANWNGTWDATVYGPTCPGAQNGTESEDCLSLNVWVPTTADASVQFNVAVWIHGGGFMQGSSWRPIYRGDNYASKANTLLVSMNYRLGALGFMAGTNDLSGNYGIMDQQLALTWVQRNIHFFNGNPKAVSIFGQSAGAMSVLTHVVSPVSAGLFSRALMSSPAGLLYHKPDYNVKLAKTLADLLLCAVTDIACLRSRNWDDITKYDIGPEYVTHLKPSDSKGISFLEWMPTVDGTILPDTPLALISKGAFTKMPLIIGSMRNETAGWIVAAVNNTVGWDLLSSTEFPTISKEVRALYDGISTVPFIGMDMALTDYLFNCYTRELAELFVANGNADTSLYVFSHVPSPAADVEETDESDNCKIAVCHAADNEFTFGSAPFIPESTFTPEEVQLSDSVIAAWSRFFDQSQPKDTTVWPLWDPVNEYIANIDIYADGTFRKIQQKYHNQTCSFWHQQGWVF